MPIFETQSGFFRSAGISTLLFVSFFTVFSPANAQDNEFSAVGHASATIIEPLSITAQKDMTFQVRESARTSTVERQAGQFEIRASGAHEFSLTIQQNVLASAGASGSGILVDQIAAWGANRVTGSELLDRSGASTIHFSGRLVAAGSANNGQYTGHVLVNLSYH